MSDRARCGKSNLKELYHALLVDAIISEYVWSKRSSLLACNLLQSKGLETGHPLHPDPSESFAA